MTLTMSLRDPATISDVLAELYENGSLLTKILVRGRPYICPFHTLVLNVPDQARVLDVGCGTGVFLNLLAASGRLKEGFGVDANGAAIGQAQRAAQSIDGQPTPTFEHRRVEDGLPEGTYDAVTMIDVLHHVDPAFQRAAIEAAAGKVGPGGVFLYKDMRKDQPVRAAMNRLHDLVLAREWIHYVAGNDVVAWMAQLGFEVQQSWREDMLWYGHEAFVFMRPASLDSASA